MVKDSINEALAVLGKPPVKTDIFNGLTEQQCFQKACDLFPRYGSQLKTATSSQAKTIRDTAKAALGWAQYRIAAHLTIALSGQDERGGTYSVAVRQNHFAEAVRAMVE